MNNNNNTLTLGDVVEIRGDLKMGILYFNNEGTCSDEVTEPMLENAGKKAYIIKVVRNGVYNLCIDDKNDIHKYTDEMLIPCTEN